MTDMKSIEELLPLYCDGKLTEEETVRVQEWIAADESNKKVLHDMADICMNMDALNIMSTVDADKAFARVSNRIKQKKARKCLMRLRNVAAMLVLPLVAALTYVLVDTRSNQEQITDVQMLEFRTNPGMTGKVILPDGSTAVLNSGSVLKYPSSFVPGKPRMVEFEGEAYFDIAKDESSIFVINTSSDERVVVYGTKFNLDVYPGRNSVATLVEGSIGFFYNDKSGNEEKVVMAPSQRLEINHDSGLVSMMETSCEAETAWKDGKILLDRTSMNDILKILSKRYDVDFVVRDSLIRKMTFSGGVITMNRLEHLLESFSISSSIHWRYLSSEDINERQKIELY